MTHTIPSRLSINHTGSYQAPRALAGAGTAAARRAAIGRLTGGGEVTACGDGSLAHERANDAGACAKIANATRYPKAVQLYGLITASG
jgi:hypothetical protein